MTDSNGIEHKYTAIGRELPEDLVKILNMGEVNYQSQGDPYFLFTNTPGEVASFFNRLSNTEMIDESLKFSNSQLRSLSDELKMGEALKASLLDRIHSLYWVEDCLSDLNDLELLNESYSAIHRKHECLSNLITIIQGLNASLAQFPQFIDVEKSLLDISTILNQYSITDTSKSKLMGLVNQIEHTKQQQQNTFLNPELDSMVQFLEKLYKELTDVLAIKNKLDTILESIHKVNDVFKLQNRTILDFEKEFSANFPNVCPLCGAEK